MLAQETGTINGYYDKPHLSQVSFVCLHVLVW